MLHLFSLVLMATAQYMSAEYFTKEPQDAFIYSGNSNKISLNCQTDAAEPTYSWKRDGRFLDTTNATKYEIIEGSLGIKIPTQEDVGRYQCVARNSDGVVVSNYGELKYAYVNDFTSSAEKVITITGNIGNGIEIPCSGANFYPADQVRIYWVFDDGKILAPPGSTKFFVLPTSGNLYFSKLELKNDDIYTCEVRSSWKTSKGSSIIKNSRVSVHLNVTGRGSLFAPSLLLKPKNASTKFGGKVVFQCYAGGSPIPRIWWSKVGGHFPSINVTTTAAGQLEINYATLDMEGIYKCHANNSEGTVEATASLSFVRTPQWIIKLEPQTSVKWSNTVEMRCKANGSTPAEYIWLKDDVELSNSDKFAITNHKFTTSLVIREATEKDAGMYQCVAHNLHGSNFSSTKLKVLVGPGSNEANPTTSNQITSTMKSQSTPRGSTKATKPPFDDGKNEQRSGDSASVVSCKGALAVLVTLVLIFVGLD